MGTNFYWERQIIKMISNIRVCGPNMYFFSYLKFLYVMKMRSAKEKWKGISKIQVKLRKFYKD